MRILRVVHRLFPPTVGGLSFHAHMLSVEQARLGHEVVVFTSQEHGYPEYERKDGYEVYRFKPVIRPLDNPLTLRMLSSLFKYHSFDIIHAHSHLMFTTNLAALKAKFSTKPFVITNHGFKVERGKLLNFAQDVYLSSVGRLTLAAADSVVSFTEQERRKTIGAGVASRRAVLIPNGVDTRFFRPIAVEPVPHSVLWAGRYVAEKGVRFLLEAARIVVTTFPDANFFLVGYGEGLAETIRLRDALGLRDHMILSPVMDQGRLLELLNRCTLFVLPSLSEGFPSTVLEAMSCRKPVVVTANIGLEEVVGDAGLYVPARDPNALANAIVTLLTNKEFGDKLGKRGRERAISRYDWLQVVERVNALFTNVIENKRQLD